MATDWLQAAGVLIGDGLMLMSPWKPIVILIPFVAWAWFVSTYLDKHALRFHLGRENWAMFHLVMGVLALIAAFSIPLPNQWAFPIGLAAMLAVLSLDIVIYAAVVNKDERVPEEFRVRFDLSSWREAKEEKAAAKKAATVSLALRRPDGSVVEPGEPESEAYALRVAAEQLVVNGLGSRASQVDIAASGNNTYVVATMVDGVRQAGDPLPAAQGVRLIDFWKDAAGLDVSDRRRRQMADIKFEYGGMKHSLRVIAQGGQGGMRLTLLFDPAGAVKMPITKLGMTDAQLEAMRAIVEDGTGVVLLAGGADGGRTTTLYAVTKMHDAYTSNVQTVEIEPQGTIEGVRQNKYEMTGEGPEFGTYVRSLLRRDPDVLSIAEVLDAQALKEAARSDHERTRVYVSLRAESALAAIQMYVKGVEDVEAAAASLRGVLAERLVRSLCTNCRVPYQASGEVLTKLGLPGDKPRQLFKKGGQVLIKNKPDVCPMCGGVGYFGQTGVFEVFSIGEVERGLIARGDYPGLMSAFRKQQLPTLQQAAILKALEGVTSLDEVTRILGEKRKRPATAGKDAAA